MGYLVDFVGLVYFHRENGGRLAMLPDGRRHDPPHTARIVVQRTAVREAGTQGWRRGPLERRLGQFTLPPCTISLTGAEGDQLNTDEHDGRLPRLPLLFSGFTVDPSTARTVATIPLHNGTLRAFRYPDSEDNDRASIVSQLELDHDGPIVITVTPTDERRDGGPRTIELRAGTEIAIVNDSIDGNNINDHFNIYDQLTDGSISVGTAVPPTPPGLAALPTNNPVFGDQIDGGDLCPNTGCC